MIQVPLQGSIVAVFILQVSVTCSKGLTTHCMQVCVLKDPMAYSQVKQCQGFGAEKAEGNLNVLHVLLILSKSVVLALPQVIPSHDSKHFFLTTQGRKKHQSEVKQKAAGKQLSMSSSREKNRRKPFCLKRLADNFFFSESLKSRQFCRSVIEPSLVLHHTYILHISPSYLIKSGCAHLHSASRTARQKVKTSSRKQTYISNYVKCMKRWLFSHTFASFEKYATSKAITDLMQLISHFF